MTREFNHERQTQNAGRISNFNASFTFKGKMLNVNPKSNCYWQCNFMSYFLCAYSSSHICSKGWRKLSFGRWHDSVHPVCFSCRGRWERALSTDPTPCSLCSTPFLLLWVFSRTVSVFHSDRRVFQHLLGYGLQWKVQCSLGLFEFHSQSQSIHELYQSTL